MLDITIPIKNAALESTDGRTLQSVSTFASKIGIPESNVRDSPTASNVQEFKLSRILIRYKLDLKIKTPMLGLFYNFLKKDCHTNNS